MPASSNAANETASSAALPRCWFYAAAALLMLIGVAAAFVQKGRESMVGQTAAKRTAAGLHETEESRNEVQQIIRDAERWQVLSLAAVFLAIVSWSIALSRHERLRGGWMVVVVFLALYVMLELMMV